MLLGIYPRAAERFPRFSMMRTRTGIMIRVGTLLGTKPSKGIRRAGVLQPFLDCVESKHHLLRSTSLGDSPRGGPNAHPMISSSGLRSFCRSRIEALIARMSADLVKLRTDAIPELAIAGDAHFGDAEWPPRDHLALTQLLRRGEFAFFTVNPRLSRATSRTYRHEH